MWIGARASKTQYPGWLLYGPCQNEACVIWTWFGPQIQSACFHSKQDLHFLGQFFVLKIGLPQHLVGQTENRQGNAPVIQGQIPQNKGHYWWNRDQVLEPILFSFAQYKSHKICKDLFEPIGVGGLNIPPFLGLRSQQTLLKVITTQEIASERIHVESAINKVKNFYIFDQAIPLFLAGSLTQMWTVCNN